MKEKYPKLPPVKISGCDLGAEAKTVCDFNYCVFCRNSTCILEQGAAIDLWGRCENCILVPFSDEILERQKKLCLEKMHSDISLQ